MKTRPLALSAAFVLAACAIAPRRPPAPRESRAILEEGRLEGTGGFPERTAALRKVDETVVEGFDDRFPPYVDVSSGTHQVALRLLDAGEPPTERVLAFRAEPARSYAVRIDTAAENARDAAVWIEDEATGEVVGGERPPPRATVVLESIERPDWARLKRRQPVRVLGRSGRVVSGRFSAFDGHYLWIVVPSGRKRALFEREIDRVVVSD